ncbi:MAG TPA: YceI family protein [Chitinophagales bacterium]|nr:YceI family protein [Chitinophagales bacterium]
MKNNFILLSALALLSFTAKNITYKVDTKASVVEWLGKKTTGQHTGTIALQSGTLNFDRTAPVNGEFVLDMKSIIVTDIKDAEKNHDFADHLKNDDFFSVDKFPTSVIKVKKFEEVKTADANYEATADLTIKGVTNQIEFPCKIDVVGDKVNAAANITIDRTKWNITYKSKSILGGMADKFIYDDIQFTVKLALKK